jgi:hypothetical protein
MLQAYLRRPSTLGPFGYLREKGVHHTRSLTGVETELPAKIERTNLKPQEAS